MYYIYVDLNNYYFFIMINNPFPKIHYFILMRKKYCYCNAKKDKYYLNLKCLYFMCCI